LLPFSVAIAMDDSQNMVNMPPELQPHLDFAANAMTVIFGFMLKRMGVLKDDHISGMRALTFSICLPMLICRVLWTAQLDGSLLTIAFTSTLMNAIQFILVAACFACADHRTKGFYMMACMGNGLAYSYQTILNTPELGSRGMAISMCWDLGGNLWVAVILHGLIAGWYAPAPISKRESPEGPEGTGSSLRDRVAAVARPLQSIFPEETFHELPDKHGANAGSSQVPNIVGNSQQVEISRYASSGVEEQDLENHHSIRNMHTLSGEVIAKMQRELRESRSSTRPRLGALLLTVVKLPMLWGAMLGLCLCCLQVPPHPLPIRMLNALSDAFPPLIYILLGVALQFDLGTQFYGQVAIALICRWMICGTMALIFRQLPVEPIAKSVVTLGYACPISTTFIVYTAQFNYPMARSIMTYNVAALVSVAVIHSLGNFV